MKKIEMKEATLSLAHYASGVGEEPVVVTADGRPVAALFPVDNVDPESFALSTNPEFMEIIERSRARLRSEGGISADEMRRRLGVER